MLAAIIIPLPLPLFIFHLLYLVCRNIPRAGALADAPGQVGPGTYRLCQDLIVLELPLQLHPLVQTERLVNKVRNLDQFI